MIEWAVFIGFYIVSVVWRGMRAPFIVLFMILYFAGITALAGIRWVVTGEGLSIGNRAMR